MSFGLQNVQSCMISNLEIFDIKGISIKITLLITAEGDNRLPSSLRSASSRVSARGLSRPPPLWLWRLRSSNDDLTAEHWSPLYVQWKRTRSWVMRRQNFRKCPAGTLLSMACCQTINASTWQVNQFPNNLLPPRQRNCCLFCAVCAVRYFGHTCGFSLWDILQRASHVYKGAVHTSAYFSLVAPVWWALILLRLDCFFVISDRLSRRLSGSEIQLLGPVCSFLASLWVQLRWTLSCLPVSVSFLPLFQLRTGSHWTNPACVTKLYTSIFALQSRLALQHVITVIACIPQYMCMHCTTYMITCCSAISEQFVDSRRVCSTVASPE